MFRHHALRSPVLSRIEEAQALRASGMLFNVWFHFGVYFIMSWQPQTMGGATLFMCHYCFRVKPERSVHVWMVLYLTFFLTEGCTYIVSRFPAFEMARFGGLK